MRKTVLVVEDSDDFRFLLESMLERAGFAVEAATNGSEALQYLVSHDAPDLIVLDLRMPVMDGPQFCRLRDCDDRLRDIPILIFSCERDADDMAKRLHANGFVSKLAPPHEIVKEVRRYCH